MVHYSVRYVLFEKRLGYTVNVQVARGARNL
jgi:hypothetical protein